MIAKKKLPFKLESSLLNNPDLAAQLESLFLEIRATLPVPDRFMALSIPSGLCNLSVNSIDLGLEEDKVAEILDWNERQRLGEVFDQKFVQHYPLKQRESETKRDYLTISYFKELGRAIHKASQPAGFAIKMFDLNIFSAANAFERIFKEKNGNRWGVWRIDEERHILLLIKSGEFSQYLEFVLDENAGYKILVNAGPGKDGEKVIAQINDLRNFSNDTIETADNLYFFTHNVDSEFYNMLLTHDVDNLKCIDPFETIKPIDLFKDDGEGVGAMSQFIDVLGLLFRFLPEVEL